MHHLRVARKENPEKFRKYVRDYAKRKGIKWNTERHKIYRQTKEGKLATKKAVKKYVTSHPEREKAWRAARSKFPIGPCLRCGNLSSHRHHPDPLKPLEVIMLCPIHHKEIHLQK